jgi:acetyl-CoA carboxylase carboxyltransferase component
MVWEPEIQELRQRRELAKKMGGPERIERHHAAGRLTVRERIDHLLDPGTFNELSALAGSGAYRDGVLVDFAPDSTVAGIGEIDGRPVVVSGTDFTIRGGSSTGTKRASKGGLASNLALAYKLPYIHLFDSAGANIEAVAELGHTYVPSDFFTGGIAKTLQRMEQAPVVSAVLGTAAGGPAGSAMLAHFTVMVKGTSSLFASGPPVVKRSLGQDVTKEELGGSQIHTRISGCIDNEAESEDDAFRQIRRFLSFMPSNVAELPPRAPRRDPPPEADAELISIVPRDRKRAYSMHRLVELLVDGGDYFEIQPGYGGSLIVALARIDGYVVGVIANNPRKLGGAMDGPAADKLERFLDLCDRFRIPLVYLVDIPGFMVGTQAEQQGTLKRGMRAIVRFVRLKVPVMTIHIRKCYGMGGAATSNSARLNYRLTWPSGEFGSIPIEGGVDAAYRRDIETSADPDQRREEIEAQLGTFRNVFRTAEAMGIEEVIDPRDTRAYLTQFVRLAYRPGVLGAHDC